MNDVIPLRLTLVGRSYCSLCDKMRAELLVSIHAKSTVIKLTEIDLDDFPEWEDKFGIRVPILMSGDFPTGEEICHYHFDEAAFVLHSMSHNGLQCPT